VSRLQWVISAGNTVQIAALCAILIFRGHHRYLPVFTVYAGGLALGSVALGLAYALDYRTWWVWIGYEVMSAALRFAVALEMAHAIFGAFPAAAMTARRLTFALLMLTVVSAMAVPEASGHYTRWTAEMITRVGTGAVWIFTGLSALVLWYRIPLTGMQRAILLAYTPYLIVSAAATSVLSVFGWQVREQVGYVDTLAYLTLVHYWCQVAWRTVPQAVITPSPAASVPQVAS
jgi:hypothetical protein